MSTGSDPLRPNRPPSCLALFCAFRVPRETAGVPAEAEFNCYRLECACKGSFWQVRGNWTYDSSEFIGPLHVQCEACKKEIRLIDLSKDGYNARIGDTFEEGDIAADIWRCPVCDASTGSLITAFGYQYDLEEPNPTPVEDSFDTFLLVHSCGLERGPVTITLFDCT